MPGETSRPIRDFTEGLDVPVADEGMSVPALQQAVPTEGIQKHFVAWTSSPER